MLYDFIVVGSGPAGTFASYGLKGTNTLVLDVGHRSAEAETSHSNFYELKRSSEHAQQLLLGGELESLHNVFHEYLSPKLKGPLMRFVTRDSQKLTPVLSENFYSIISLAQGGLANAWGAGVYEFTDDDLTGFPIKASDLAASYREVSLKIGVSGEQDDLSADFGANADLMPAPKLDAGSAALLARYVNRRSTANTLGLRIGRPRLAVLTREHDERNEYAYRNLDFFVPGDRAVYNPRYTLEKLIQKGEVKYQDKILVERFEETSDGVTVICRDLGDGSERKFTARKVLLAAGTLNTSRIVLRSFGDTTSKLPILDNGIAYIPIIDFFRIGAAQETNILPTCALNGIYTKFCDRLLQMSIYGMSGTLRSDFLMDFPLAVRGNLAASRYLVPAMLVAQLFYPDSPHPSNFLKLESEGQLKIDYSVRQYSGAQRPLASAFRRLGLGCFASLAKELTPGNSFHYVGTLPMKENPTQRFETDRNGQLHGTERVYIADAANFSNLPSKNHTLTIMANALRISRTLRDR